MFGNYVNSGECFWYFERHEWCVRKLGLDVSYMEIIQAVVCSCDLSIPQQLGYLMYRREETGNAPAWNLITISNETARYYWYRFWRIDIASQFVYPISQRIRSSVNQLPTSNPNITPRRKTWQATRPLSLLELQSDHPSRGTVQPCHFNPLLPKIPTRTIDSPEHHNLSESGV